MLFKRVLWVPCHEHDWVTVCHWDCACELDVSVHLGGFRRSDGYLNDICGMKRVR